MNTIKAVVFILILCVSYLSCTKGPGEGGRATIRGTVYARNYNNNFELVDSGFIGAQNVYIKYGDEYGIADNTDTDPTGEFYFNYLRKGKYQIIVYTTPLLNNHLDSAIVKEIEITSKNQELVIPQINIVTFNN